MTDTTDTNVAEWEKELKVLLGIIQDHPSRDLSDERERVVLLNKLIAARGARQDA